MECPREFPALGREGMSRAGEKCCSCLIQTHPPPRLFPIFSVNKDFPTFPPEAGSLHSLKKNNPCFWMELEPSRPTQIPKGLIQPGIQVRASFLVSFGSRRNPGQHIPGEAVPSTLEDGNLSQKKLPKGKFSSFSSCPDLSRTNPGAKAQIREENPKFSKKALNFGEKVPNWKRKPQIEGESLRFWVGSPKLQDKFPN